MLVTTRETLAAALNRHTQQQAAAALVLAEETDLDRLFAAAAELRDRSHRNVISYSKGSSGLSVGKSDWFVTLQDLNS